MIRAFARRGYHNASMEQMIAVIGQEEYDNLIRMGRETEDLNTLIRSLAERLRGGGGTMEQMEEFTRVLETFNASTAAARAQAEAEGSPIGQVRLLSQVGAEEEIGESSNGVRVQTIEVGPLEPLSDGIQQLSQGLSAVMMDQQTGDSDGVQVHIAEIEVFDLPSPSAEMQQPILNSSAAEPQIRETNNDLQVHSVRIHPLEPFSAGSERLNHLVAQWEINYRLSMELPAHRVHRAPLATLPRQTLQQILEISRNSATGELPSPPSSADSQSQRSRHNFESLLAESARRRRRRDSRPISFFDTRFPTTFTRNENTTPSTPPKTPEELEVIGERHVSTLHRVIEQRNRNGATRPSVPESQQRSQLPAIDERTNDHESAWEVVMRMPQPRDENGERRLPTVDEVVQHHDRSWDQLMRMPEPREEPRLSIGANRDRLLADVLRMPSLRDENGEVRLPTVDEVIREHDRSWDRLVRSREFSNPRVENEVQPSSSREEYVDSSETESETEFEDMYASLRSRHGYIDSSETDSEDESLYPASEDDDEGYLSGDTLVEDSDASREVHRFVRVERRHSLQRRNRRASTSSTSTAQGDRRHVTPIPGRIQTPIHASSARQVHRAVNGGHRAVSSSRRSLIQDNTVCNALFQHAQHSSLAADLLSITPNPRQPLTNPSTSRQTSRTFSRPIQLNPTPNNPIEIHEPSIPKIQRQNNSKRSASGKKIGRVGYLTNQGDLGGSIAKAG